MPSSNFLRSAVVLLAGANAVLAQSTTPTPTPSNAVPTAAQTLFPDPQTAANSGAASYANMPHSWPDPDQSHGPIKIQSLLTSALVQDGMARVRAAVPASLLNVAVQSTQPVLGVGTVNYVGDTTTAGMCYFQTQCFRSVAANGYQPDVLACPAANTWGLTFDDGPTSPVDGLPTDNTTRNLTAALATIKVNATMFVVGSQSYYHPEEVLAAYQAGHEIAVHTWTHAALTTLSNEQIVAEILFSEAMITRTIGVRPQLFRPPYGDLDDRVRAIAGALGYRTILWGTGYDSQDSAGASLDSVLATARGWMKAGPGFITLNHNSGNVTTQKSVEMVKLIASSIASNALPLTIQGVGQCLGVSPYRPVSSTATTTSSSASARPTTSSAGVATASTSTRIVDATSSSSHTTSATSTSTPPVVDAQSGAGKAAAGLIGAAGIAAFAAGLVA